MNLLTRWSRHFDDSDLRIQAYVDHAEREDRNTFSPEADVVDIELQHSLRHGKHRYVWGGGYRHGSDDVQSGMFLGLIPSGFIPSSRELEWWNIFGQADFSLMHELTLTAGLKFEHNDYTGVEHLPSVRPDLELSLTVRNAFDPEHPEFNAPATRSEIARDVYGQIRWGF